MSEEFTAFALAGELDLNRLAAELGIVRKYRWEEAMLLDPVTLKSITGEMPDQQKVYLYSFGGIVFLNCSDDTIGTFSDRMRAFIESFVDLRILKFQEQYSLRIEESAEISVSNDSAVMPRYNKAYVDIIASVIAKSVALERIEEQVDMVLDEMEDVITLLGRGKLGIPDRKLARLSARILQFSHRSIAYIMVLDKPEITWNDQVAESLYLKIANLFEINQRYLEIKQKSESLMDITTVFSGLSHARRASRLEIIIIVLILFELLLSLWRAG